MENGIMPSLYRRLLGESFDSLPPALRDFHDVERERHFQAVFRITRGKGWLRNLVCKLGGLPPAGEAVPMKLRVFPDGEREHWVREFDKHRLESVQWARDGLMVESIGAMRLGFRLHVEGATLRLELRRAWFLGVRWPLWLAPRAEGTETGQADGCAIVVRASAPLLGLLVQYEGLVTRAEL
jgi:Domain of unknown function (DUF4166)